MKEIITRLGRWQMRIWEPAIRIIEGDEERKRTGLSIRVVNQRGRR